jgi:hypothetical protein
LTAKHYKKFAEAGVFPEDFSVSQPRRYRRIPAKNCARGRAFSFRFEAVLLFSLENKIDVELSEPSFSLDLQMLQYKTTETEIARELLDRIRESPRAHLPGGRHEPLERFRTTEPRHAQCCVRSSQP